MNKEKKESIAFITKKVMCTRACVHAQSLSVVSTLCDPKDSTLPGSSIHEIILARILGWVAISSSRGSSLSRDQTCISSVSCIRRQILYH